MVILLGGGQDTEREQAFLAAAKAGELGFVQAHLQGGVSLDVVDAEGKGAAHLAAAEGHNGILRALHGQGEDFERRDHHERTPVLDAMAAGKLHTARYLLKEAKVDAQVLDENGHGLVWCAAQHAENGWEEPLWLALRHVDTPDTVDKRGYTPLCQSAERRSINGFFLLLLAGADPDHHDRTTGTDLIGLVERNGESEFEIVLDAFLQLPKVPQDLSAITHAELVAENPYGKRLLDNPRLWRRMPEVIEALERQGEPLPDREELTRHAVIDYSPMVLAVVAGKAGALEHCLAAHGDTVTPADYQEPRFCEAAVGMGVLEAQMQPQQWLGKGDALRKFYQELPEKARDSIGNYHQIRLEVEAGGRGQNAGRGR